MTFYSRSQIYNSNFYQSKMVVGEGDKKTLETGGGGGRGGTAARGGGALCNIHVVLT